jgi:hypothetical protein
MRADDPRLATVRSNFAENLDDIIATGRRARGRGREHGGGESGGLRAVRVGAPGGPVEENGSGFTNSAWRRSAQGNSRTR